MMLLEVRVVPARARRARPELVDERRAREHGLLRDVRHAVHRVRDVDTVQWIVVGSSSAFFSVTRTRSPSYTRISGPGTRPLYAIARTTLPGASSHFVDRAS